MTAGPIREVVVAGGGLLGWSCAAALRRKLPAIRVTVVPLPPPPDALADRIGSTLPSIIDFHRDIGLEDDDPILRANAGFRLGTLFEGWNDGRPGYVHAYDRYGQPLGTASFHIHWVRQALAGSVKPFDSHSAAVAMARAGKFITPQEDPAALFGQFGFGLSLDVPRYTQMLRAYALHLGTIERPDGIAEVRLRGDGFIESLVLDSGTALTADLFVDCTGPRALLRGQLDQAFDDWAEWLPCDRMLFAAAPPSLTPSPLDQAVAHEAGWCWVAQSRANTSHGIAYASNDIDDDAAAQMLQGRAGAAPGAPIALRQGRRPEPWLRNCVAIGDAAVSVEPLEWSNLHLAHNAIDRLVAMMPDRDCAAVELWDYNRQCAAEAMRVRDFLALHYAASMRDEPFWQRARTAPLPDSLQHTLDLFRERGRLPFYEDETFTRDSWLAVLLGQGVHPRRADPLIESVPSAVSERAMAGLRETIAATVARLPSHADFLRNLFQQAQR